MEILNTNGSPQSALICEFSPITLHQDFAGIVRDPGVPHSIDIHDVRMGTEGLGSVLSV